MIDIKLLRESPEIVKENLRKKFQDDKIVLVDKLRKKDVDWRNLKTRADKLRHERNKISKQVAEAKRAGKSATQLIKKAKLISGKIAEIEIKYSKLQAEINEILKKIPNIIHESVPIGRDAADNVERERIGKIPSFNFEAKNHTEIGEALGMLDFDSSAKTSGNGFYFLKRDIALLNQALINYARDFMVENGYEYVEPPLMIRKEILEGVYSSAEIEQMVYKIEGEDIYLIATSEHPLIGMFINSVLRKEDLPIKLTGYSMCFRKEIGSHGIDEKGLYRTHQFNKQEMVVICHPKDSYKYYGELLSLSKTLFKNLGIPIREMESCSGDLADLKAKGADLEAWSPRQKKFFEITSVTNMEEAQARRLNIRFADEKNNYRFVHTLNNTAIATSRALVAIIENYQNKDGTITVPKVLQKYMNGKKVIGKKN